jgi:hypothetical protein
MSSQKRKDASRKNGALGGPKSPEGKARSSENAIKHNLYAKHCQALSTESEELFVELRARLFRDYDPQTTIECETVEQLAMAAWRIRRYGTSQAWFLEMEMANQAEWIASTEGEDCDSSLRAAHAIKACLEKSSGFRAPASNLGCNVTMSASSASSTTSSATVYNNPEPPPPQCRFHLKMRKTNLELP